MSLISTCLPILLCGGLLSSVHAEPRIPGAPSFVTVHAIPAQPLSPGTMRATRGKALSLPQFFALATATTLAPGVTAWTYSSDGDPVSVTATWSTGTTSGSGTILKR
jgi:hypothetical protein